MTRENNSTVQQLTEEQILEIGTAASQALQNPIYAIICEMMLSESMKAIDAAPADHIKEVMWHKQRRQVVGDVFSNLKQMVGHAERILAERQEKNSQAYKEAKHMDTQGYGLNFGGAQQ